MQRQKVDYKFLFSDLNISEEILYLCRHKLKAINQGGGGGIDIFIGGSNANNDGIDCKLI